jgi:hypothetical protein
MKTTLHAILGISLISVAFAQNPSEKPDYSGYSEAKLYDKNKDGKVSLEEFKSIWEGDFDGKDNLSVPDGKIYSYELNVSDAFFQGMDTDNNRYLDKQEWMKPRLDYFQRTDLNKDGALEIGVEWIPAN